MRFCKGQEHLCVVARQPSCCWDPGPCEHEVWVCTLHWAFYKAAPKLPTNDGLLQKPRYTQRQLLLATSTVWSHGCYKPYIFIGFGALDATKPCTFIGFGAMDEIHSVWGHGCYKRPHSQAHGRLLNKRSGSGSVKTAPPATVLRGGGRRGRLIPFKLDRYL